MPEITIKTKYETGQVLHFLNTKTKKLDSGKIASISVTVVAGNTRHNKTSTPNQQFYGPDITYNFDMGDMMRGYYTLGFRENSIYPDKESLIASL